MMGTRRSLPTLLLASALAAVVFGPSCGGGPSGTAHSTVQGNVAAVEQAMRGSPRAPTLLARLLDLVRPTTSAWAQNGLEGIRVTLEGTSFETETNETGAFAIESPFSGAGALVFEREDDQLVARIGVDVPAGGTVTLRNVRCSRGRGSCSAEAIEVEQPSEPSEPSEPSDGGDSSGGSPLDVSDPSEPSVAEPRVSEPAGPSAPSEPSVSEDGRSDG